MMTRRTFSLTLAALLGSRSLLAQPSAGLDSLVWALDTIAWEPDDPPGSKYAVLQGDRDRPGTLFTYAFLLPGGVWAPPHFHSQAAHVAVLKGTLKLGFGSKADRSLARAIPAGQFFVVPANQPHFEGSDDECLIVGTAMGGWKTTVIG